MVWDLQKSQGVGWGGEGSKMCFQFQYFCMFPKENVILSLIYCCWHGCLYLASRQSPSIRALILHCGVVARHSCCRFYCASSELVSYKGIVQHDREFQPPRYLGIGRLMIAVQRFNTVKANTI